MMLALIIFNKVPYCVMFRVINMVNYYVHVDDVTRDNIRKTIQEHILNGEIMTCVSLCDKAILVNIRRNYKQIIT